MSAFRFSESDEIRTHVLHIACEADTFPLHHTSSHHPHGLKDHIFFACSFFYFLFFYFFRFFFYRSSSALHRQSST